MREKWHAADTALFTVSPRPAGVAMRAWTQRRWAIVHTYNGHIDHSTIQFNRRPVIVACVARWRLYPWFVAKHPNLTDAQFWRVIKRHRGLSVRRITMRVSR